MICENGAVPECVVVSVPDEGKHRGHEGMAGIHKGGVSCVTRDTDVGPVERDP